MKIKIAPKERPKLFSFRADWWHNACLNYLPDSWDIYIMGYKNAADLLVAEIVETQTHQDSLLYPIVFMYRHYFELRIKTIIRDCAILQDNKYKIPGHHKIYKLWTDVRPEIENIFKDDDVSLLDDIDDVLKDFENFDPIGTAFRYPINKNGDMSIPGCKYINIVQFQELINNAIELLEGISCGLSEYQSYKQDMIRNSY